MISIQRRFDGLRPNKRGNLLDANGERVSEGLIPKNQQCCAHNVSMDESVVCEKCQE
jgi:hypothetical protein